MADKKNTIRRVWCPACGTVGNAFDPSCCVSPAPRVQRTYVAVDALLSDEAVARAVGARWRVDKMSTERLEWAMTEARAMLRAAVDAVTGERQ